MLKMSIIGNLTKDPEVRPLPSGTQVVSFTVASTRKVNGEDKTDFVRVSVFGKRGAACAMYLAKGRKVYARGVPSARAYTNRNGENVASMEIMADEIEFLSSRNDSPAPQNTPQQIDEQMAQTGFTEIDDGELPF